MPSGHAEIMKRGILHQLASAKKEKNQQRVMKREKFATQDKTKQCGAPDCPNPGTTIKFGKEKRILCKKHLQQLNRKHETYPVIFKKASTL